MELEFRLVEVQGAHEIWGRAQREGARPPVSWTARGPLALILSPKILINSEKCLRGFPGHSENFSFLHINNTMAILLKTASVRVSSIQIMQVRVQKKGKSVWKSRYDGDVSKTTHEE